MLTTNPQGTTSGTFQANERISGGTSGAIGQLRSDQSVTSSKIYYFPIKGTFVQNEVITGATSSATAQLVNNTDAVRGQLGFIFVAEGLSTGPDQGGSVEMVDNGSNNDAGSYVISSSSYSAPDGRGSLTATRGQLGTTAATHDGTSSINLFPAAGSSTTLTAAINNSVTNVDVASLTGMAANGFIVVGNELMIITGFVDADTITVTRAQEGTTAAAHSNGAAVQVLGAKVTGQDEVIKDLTASSTDIRTAQAGIVFKATDYIKIGNEFMKLTAAAADTTGITILNFADEKTIGCGDGQQFKTRYRYSQVRLTAHDFLDVGTGNRANTNWPFLSLSPNIPSQEVDENRPGRVYYVSTDQDGNFAVGKFFKVEQATGKATLDASAFDLSGLSSLRLGSIGAQLGASINEFSTDGTLGQNSDVKVPTQKAVRTYVSTLDSVAGNFEVAGNLTVKGTTTTVASVDVETKDRNLTLAKVAAGSFTGNMTSGQNTITSISDTTNIAPGVVITLTSGGASVTLSGTVKVTALSGTTATLDASFGGTGSATGATFGAGGPTDVTADGGGLTIKGSTDKTIAFNDASDRFDISENLNIPSGKAIYINGTEVLSSTQVLGVSLSGGGGAGAAVTTDGTQTLTNKTYTDAILAGTLTAGGSAGSAGKYLESTGSGVQWTTLNVNATSITNGNTNATAANNGNITVETGGSLCATFNTSNNLVVVGTVTAQSSIALKDNVETIPNALSRVLNLRGVEWDYKSNGTHNMGVVAEEVEKEFPCLVHEGADGIKSVAYANIVGVLIEAVKDLKSEIDELRRK